MSRLSSTVRLLMGGRISPQLAHLEGKKACCYSKHVVALRSSCWGLKLEALRFEDRTNKANQRAHQIVQSVHIKFD